jgi:hypothetical protein
VDAASRAVVRAAFVGVVLAGCTPAGGPTTSTAPQPSAAEVSSPTAGCPLLAMDDALVGTYRSADGKCAPYRRIIAVRCTADGTPVVVQRLGHRRSVVHLGGPFAVPVRSLPPDAVEIGVSASERVHVADGQLFVEASGSITRWLALRRSRRILRAPPDAWMVGDSILDGARDALPAVLPRWRITVDAEIGRSSSGGLFPLAQAAIAEPEVVVVELGTNDEDPSVFRANADAMLADLASVPLVLWVVPHAPATQVPAVSQELREAVSLHPNAAVADWDAFVPEEMLSDGVHLLPDQQAVFAEFLAPYLSQWLSAVRGHGPIGCLDTVRTAIFERP